MKIFSIRDGKAECYYPPFFKKSMGEAERDFTELTRDEKSMVAKYPEDFDLYYLGDYNDLTGQIKPLDTPQHIVKAVQLKG